MNSFEIIKTVRVTEKGTRQSEKYNQYTVVADRRANKTEIRQAVQELFKVKVTQASTPSMSAAKPAAAAPPSPAAPPTGKKPSSPSAKKTRSL